MTKSQYRLQCLRRSSSFLDSVLAFHQKYPPVFIRSLPVARVPLPKWLAPLVRQRGNVLIGVPETPQDLERLSGLAAETAITNWGLRRTPSAPKDGTRLLPADGASYFNALGAGSPEEWEKDFEAIKGKWTDVPPSALRWPAAEQFVPRPRIVGASAELPPGVLMLIPIYNDTTEAERDEVWREAMKLKRALYGEEVTKRRTRLNLFEKKLRVWDAYQRLRNYRSVGRELRLPVSTVKRLRAAAFLDIEGEPLRGSIKERRAAATNAKLLTEAWALCARCSKVERMEDLCATHKPALDTYVNQNSKAGRALPPAMRPKKGGRVLPKKSPD